MPAALAATPPQAAEPAASDSGPTRRERKAASTRRAILESARALFEERGYTETTVDQIAEHADVAPRTFFRYFPNKEALLFAEFDEERAAMLALLEARPRDEDPLVSIAVALSAFAEVLHRRRDELAWGYRMCSEQDVLEVYERSMMQRRTHTRIAEFLGDRLQVDPEIDPRPVAWSVAVMGVFSAVLKPATTRSGEGDAPDVDEIRQLLVSTLTSTARALEDVAAVVR